MLYMRIESDIVSHCVAPCTISSLWMRCVALFTNAIRVLRLLDHPLRTSLASLLSLKQTTPPGRSMRA